MSSPTSKESTRHATDTSKHYALGTAALVTSVIGLVWLTTVPARFSNMSLKAEAPDIANIVDVQEQVANLIQNVPKEEPVTSNLDALAEIAEAQDAIETEGLYDLEKDDVADSTSTDVHVRVYDTPEPKMILIGTTTKHTVE
jgi:hypothetical protein